MTTVTAIEAAEMAQAARGPRWELKQSAIMDSIMVACKAGFTEVLHAKLLDAYMLGKALAWLHGLGYGVTYSAMNDFGEPIRYRLHISWAHAAAQVTQERKHGK